MNNRIPDSCEPVKSKEFLEDILEARTEESKKDSVTTSELLKELGV